LTRERGAKVHAAVDEAFPGLRRAFEATLVGFRPEPDPPPPDPASERRDKLRAEIAQLLRDVGRWQTGKPVNYEWIFHAAGALASSALGCIDFELDGETVPEALEAVRDAARRQWKHDRPADAAEDIPF
jgi:hypothetical protein